MNSETWRLQQIHNSNPIAASFWDANFNVVDCNDAMVKLLELSDKNDFINGFLNFAPETLPDGTPAAEKVGAVVAAVYEHGYCRFPWTHLTTKGESIPGNATVVKIDLKETHMFATYFQDLRYLREADEQAKLIMDATPLAVTLYGRDFMPIDCNMKAVELFESASKDEYFDSFNSYFPPYEYNEGDSHELLEGYLKKAFREGYAHASELVCQKKDGTPIATESTYIRIRYKEDCAVIEFARDITEERNAMEREREKEITKRVQLMFDATPLIIEYWDKGYNPIDCNQTALDFFGFLTKDEYKQHRTSPNFHRDDTPIRSRWNQELQEIFESGKGNFEFVEQMPSGETAFMKVDGIRMKYNDELIVVTYSTDLTLLNEKEREAEETREALKYREKLLKTVNQIAGMLMAVDNERGFRNDLIHSLEMLGKCLNADRVQLWRATATTNGFNTALANQWLSEIGRSSPQSPLAQSVDFGSLPKWEEMFLNGECFNGMIKDLPEQERQFFNPLDTIKSLVAIPIYLQDQFWGLLNIDDCVNGRIASDEEIDILRTASLMMASTYHRIALQGERQRMEIAEESNRAKSRFLARMSHEIRTPITAVLGISEIQLQSSTLPPQIDESFSKIHSSAVLLLGIINDILDLSKIEAGKMELLQENYDVANMIRDVSHMRLAYLGDKDITFRLDADENLPKELTGDVVRVEQILSNILSNAFKYTESGTVKMSLQCQPGSISNSSDKDYVTITASIRDSGLGMTPEQLTNLRQNNDYTRFHERENRFISGTGLGMPIVYNLIQMMDAQIDIESEEGNGTLVMVRIPQKVSNPEPLGKETVHRLQQLKSNTAPSGTKKFQFTTERMPYGNVLVVDDIDANLYVVKGLLDFYDLNIETCLSGREAIEKVEQGKTYDIIFMDHMMPGMNGIEALQILRSMDYAKPIIALTANALIGQAEEFMQIGFDGFISKPIQAKNLNSILNKLIRDKYPLEVREAAMRESKPALHPAYGIENFQNDASLVNKLRVDFAKSQRNTYAEIARSLTKGDTKHAHLICHSLKSTSWLIKEEALSKMAGDLEHLLANSKSPTENDLSALEAELTRVLESISIPESDLATGGKHFDKEKAFALFGKLHPLLKTRNSESLNYLDELRTMPETAVLVRQISEFKFAAALETLETLEAVFAD